MHSAAVVTMGGFCSSETLKRWGGLKRQWEFPVLSFSLFQWVSVRAGRIHSGNVLGIRVWPWCPVPWGEVAAALGVWCPQTPTAGSGLSPDGCSVSGSWSVLWSESGIWDLLIPALHPSPAVPAVLLVQWCCICSLHAGASMERSLASPACEPGCLLCLEVQTLCVVSVLSLPLGPKRQLALMLENHLQLTWAFISLHVWIWHWNTGI